jgi:hypothetical protein
MSTPWKAPLLILVSLLFSSQTFSQLNRQWVARFSGNAKNGSNEATAMAVDPDSGYVYVTGWVTQKGTGIDVATLKYSPDGELLWAAYYPPAGTGVDKPTSIAFDSAANVYVTGTTTTGTATTDYLTLKYDRNGTLLWSETYDGPGHGEDHPVAVAVNDSLNVYVTGWSMGAGTGFDYATIKYKATGDTAWVRRYNGPSSGTDSALAMALRGNTDLIVTGASVDSGYDYLTIKYTPTSGDTVWIARYNGLGMGNDIPRAVLARSASEVFVTGSSQNLNGDYDYLTLRYNGTGVLQWASRYDGAAGADDQAYAIAVQGSSRVYVTGRSLVPGSFNDILTVRYNPNNGAQNWASAYNGTAYDDDGAVGMLGGSSPYVLGYSAGAGTGKDYALVQYDGGNGDINVSWRYNGPANGDDVPVAIGSAGSTVVVTGKSAKAKGSEFLTIQYQDPAAMKYRSFLQQDLTAKAANVKSGGAPNAGNVRDDAVLKAYPKIKKGYAGAPGGLVVGNPRPDSASVYGWMRFDKGKAVAAYLPAGGISRGFDLYGMGMFLGEKKNPKRTSYDNHMVGELITLLINIGASDAEITPPTLGDLTYDDGDTSNHFNGLTLRQLAALADNYLTYWKRYPVINWAVLDSMLSRTNRAFIGPLKIISAQPVAITGAVLLDSVAFLKPAMTPILEPLAFIPGSLDLVPERAVLYQNYPNPFNPVTTISFDLPEESRVTLKVYDILGREVATLLENEDLDAGTNEIPFNARALATGIYFYRIDVNNGQFHQIKKMMLVK